jgi:hypothetical protein
MVLAMILAHVVLPTPLGPQNKNACAKVLVLIAFCNVDVIDFCPTTLSKVIGLYFLADTTKLSMLTIFSGCKITSFPRFFLFFYKKSSYINANYLFLHIWKNIENKRLKKELYFSIRF